MGSRLGQGLLSCVCVAHNQVIKAGSSGDGGPATCMGQQGTGLKVAGRRLADCWAFADPAALPRTRQAAQSSTVLLERRPAAAAAPASRTARPLTHTRQAGAPTGRRGDWGRDGGPRLY